MNILYTQPPSSAISHIPERKHIARVPVVHDITGLPYVQFGHYDRTGKIVNVRPDRWIDAGCEGVFPYRDPATFQEGLATVVGGSLYIAKMVNDVLRWEAHYYTVLVDPSTTASDIRLIRCKDFHDLPALRFNAAMMRQSSRRAEEVAEQVKAALSRINFTTLEVEGAAPEMKAHLKMLASQPRRGAGWTKQVRASLLKAVDFQTGDYVVRDYFASRLDAAVVQNFPIGK